MKCPNALQDIKKKIMYDFQKFLHEFYLFSIGYNNTGFTSENQF